jgi:hypothetical protein
MPHRTTTQRYRDTLARYTDEGWEIIFDNGSEATLIRALEDGLAICDLFKGESVVIAAPTIVPYEAIDRLRAVLVKVEACE